MFELKKNFKTMRWRKGNVCWSQRFRLGLSAYWISPQESICAIPSSPVQCCHRFATKNSQEKSTFVHYVLSNTKKKNLGNIQGSCGEDQKKIFISVELQNNFEAMFTIYMIKLRKRSLITKIQISSAFWSLLEIPFHKSSAVTVTKK